MNSKLPSGTVTFLFTDIEGSTKLAQEHPDAMPELLARHHHILNEAIHAQNGYVFLIVGDSFAAAFHNVSDALNAQRQLQTESWSPAPIKVRMGIHTGAARHQAESKDTPYVGYATLASAQRVMSVAHGGQVLFSHTSYDLLQNNFPENISLRDMGEHRLKDVRSPMRLYQLVAPDLPQDFPVIKSLDTLPNNLPIQLTSFIGREKEIADIKGLLDTARLVTLTGSGGTGKTRLSQEVGAQLLTNFPRGVWFIELALLSDATQIIPALARVFGLQEQPFNPLANLVLDYLRDRKILLILDNCEHLIEACARLADDLLHQCAGLRILASSREALGIVGEVAYRIPSLADSESDLLFVERARAVNSNFKLTDANASAIAQICHRLDGIPLALELAAARVKLLAPEQLAERLDDRFRLLIGGSRTALPRQQTLRALIDWSYDLLSAEEKRLLQFASVLVGGWTLDALEAVADDPNTFELLEQLVNKSLVVTEERESEMRYFLLETIKQYARKKLFEAKQSSAACDRHFVYFDALSEKMWEVIRSTYALPMINRAEDEVENFRAALDWGLENHVEENVRLAANFCITSLPLGILAEGVRVAKTAVERAKALPSVEGAADIRRQKWIAKALFAQGITGLGTGNIPVVKEYLKEAIVISRVTGDKLILGYSLEFYFAASTFINVPDGTAAAQEGLNIFSQEVNDKVGLTLAYINMARVSMIKGDEDEKQVYLGKLKEITSGEAVGWFLILTYANIGFGESQRGNYETAKIFEDSLAAAKGMHYFQAQLVCMSEIGHIERHTGNLTQAKSIYQETIKGWQKLGQRSAIANQLECYAFIAIIEEEPHRAATFFGAAEALSEKAQTPMADYEHDEYDQSVSRLRSMLAEAEFKALWAEGRSMTIEQAIQYAVAS